MEITVCEESEQIVADAGVWGRDGGKFGLKRGEEGRLELDQIVTVVRGAAFVSVGAGAELGHVHADTIGICFVARLRARGGEYSIRVVEWNESDGFLLEDEGLEFLGGQ